ncbi:uncharacterized protein LOC112457032 [Temnothorax curvispinosus]|uniref:Uncharacterized protein LOC112457032 n=1 Tax=Temnothorax curvispinosus TaxID=300111 RepID=A0A6J1Q2G2_9HYME|nr:uncharacterized protein LOC112457032 [Temnothorax curvispinosus]
MADILSIGGEPLFDDRIVKIETQTYNPYANTTFGHSDKIRIPIQQQDLYTLPCESFLYIERVLSDDIPKTNSDTTMDNNYVAFMFDEIRYELNGVEIDRNRNVGITSLIKNFVSLTAERSRKLQNAGWTVIKENVGPRLRTKIDDFNFCVPLNVLLGFCGDYKHVVINARHELILIRSRNDANCIITKPERHKNPTITLLKVQWRMPHVVLNDVNKLFLLRTLESGRYLSMGFRSHSWAVKAATQLEKPRYVIFALQTGRSNDLLKHASEFDDGNLTNVKLYLNSDFYPYDDMNLDFEKRKTAILYEMYAKFQKLYYRCKQENALLTMEEFDKWGPFVVIDCSRQNESVKSATVDVRIEFDCKRNIDSNTTAYCFIIHDRVIEYNPLTNIVRKIV